MEKAFWVGIGTAVVYAGVLGTLSYFYCKGYTGHWPTEPAWVWACASAGGLFKGAEAARKAS